MYQAGPYLQETKMTSWFKQGLERFQWERGQGITWICCFLTGNELQYPKEQHRMNTTLPAKTEPLHHLHSKARKSRGCRSCLSTGPAGSTMAYQHLPWEGGRSIAGKVPSHPEVLACHTAMPAQTSSLKGSGRSRRWGPFSEPEMRWGPNMKAGRHGLCRTRLSPDPCTPLHTFSSVTWAGHDTAAITGTLAVAGITGGVSAVTFATAFTGSCDSLDFPGFGRISFSLSLSLCDFLSCSSLPSLGGQHR